MYFGDASKESIYHQPQSGSQQVLSFGHVGDKDIEKRYCKIKQQITRSKILFYGSYGQKLRLGYFWVADSNKILAVAVAVSSFMLFKNLGIRYSKFINAVASAAFGVLLIHANSDTMRQWLWKDTLDNVGWYMGVTGSGSMMIIVLHAIVSVIAVYSVCTLVEYIRIRYTEKPMLDVAEHAVLRAWRKISCGIQQGD